MRQMLVGSDDDGLHAMIASLNMAVSHGHIRQEQADERLRLLQNSDGGSRTMIDEVPCRVNKRGQTVRVWKDQFCPMPGQPERLAWAPGRGAQVCYSEVCRVLSRSSLQITRSTTKSG